MVQSLVRTSPFLFLMTGKSKTQEHAWHSPTLFHLQSSFWPGLSCSYLMRWRYFILTHPAKCKMTRTEFSLKLRDAFNITQTSNQFVFSFSFFLLSFFLLIEQSYFLELGNVRMLKGIFKEKLNVSLLTLKI